MIYMAGDNNLSVDMSYAMQQIKEVIRSNEERVNLLVYYDGYSSAIPTLYCDFSDIEDPKHWRSFKVRNKLYPVEVVPDESAADPNSVINFIDWCVNKVEFEKDGKTQRGRKAVRYGLIFSGHTLGFQDIGLFKDETSDKTMTMQEMNDLLERITGNEEQLISRAEAAGVEPGDLERETSVILGQKLDILGFDSCVMSMLEVGYQFESVAKTMVASEGSVPNAGWTYGKILGGLAKAEEEQSSNEIAAGFVEEFVLSQDSYTVGGVSVDLAAWDLSRLDGLTDEFEKLADAILKCFENPESSIFRHMERVVLQVHWKCQSYMYDQNIDLGDFCELLREECESLSGELKGDAAPSLQEVVDSCSGVLEALKQTVILSGFSGGLYQFSNGISLFFPWSFAALEVSQENYESLEFVRDTGAGKIWYAFLQKYLGEITLRSAPAPTSAVTGPIGEKSGPAQPEDTKVRYYSFEYDDLGENGGESPAPEAARIAGQEGTKIAGQEGTKIAGQEGTKIAGQEGTKIAGQEGTKIAGQEGTKIAGQEGTKLAGEAASSSFFERFRRFKNIDTPWNISGFSKRPARLKLKSDAGKASG